MTDLAEIVASWIQALRIASPGQWALRGLVAAAGAAAVLACWWWIPAPTSVLALALALAVWSALGPGSWGPFLLSLTVVIWWVGGGGAPWWRVLLLALLLAVAHLGAAYAAAAPSWATVTSRAAGRMARAGASYLLVCAALALLVWGVSLLAHGVLPGGVGWVAAGGVALGWAVVAAVLEVRRRSGRRAADQT